MLQGDMRRAVEIPSKSILFNIDQKADTISKTEIDAVLSVFMKVFNEMLGYSGDHPHIAHMERYLDEKGKLSEFHDNFRDETGQEWTAIAAELLEQAS